MEENGVKRKDLIYNFDKVCETNEELCNEINRLYAVYESNPSPYFEDTLQKLISTVSTSIMHSFMMAEQLYTGAILEGFKYSWREKDREIKEISRVLKEGKTKDRTSSI